MNGIKKLTENDMEWWVEKYILLRLFMKYMYLKILQQVYITVSHIHKNTYEIQYVLHDKLYKIRTKVKRGPSKITCILDHQDCDITDDIRSYMGPNEDFHGQPMTPNDLGYEWVYVFLRNGDTLSFTGDQEIVLT